MFIGPPAVLLLLVGLAPAMPAAAAAAPALVRPNALAPGAAPAGSAALGAVPGSQGLDLRVVLSPSNGDQLQALLRNLYDPGSPEYHQWLGPGQFVQQFGPSSSQVTAVESWLHSAGLTQTWASGFAVDVSAPASQVSAALGTSFERYRAPSGHVGYLAQEAPAVPLSLAGQIAAILGLNTVAAFEPQNTLAPPIRSESGGTAMQPNADGLTPCAAAQEEAASGYYTLDALGAAYGIGSLLTDGQNGSRETIGLYELASHSASDVSTYESCFGLTNPVGTVAVDGGGGAVGGTGTPEADLDIEQAATQAPGSSIISYEGPNTTTGAYDTWDTIVSADTAQAISTSWDMCEPEASSAGEIPAFTTLFEQAATQGQTVLAASGDSGSEGCFLYGGSTAEQVDYPASDPWVTAVGGTSLYAPGDETAWNYCQSDESITCANNHGGYAAGGGGLSRYESALSYQPEILYWPTAQSCGTYCREVPDISANAGAPMVVYTNGAWQAGGGTSFAAPFMAGLVADKNGGCTTLTGVWAPALYALYDDGSYGTAFTDITSGNTDMTGSNSGEYPATTGYDAATGIGSPIASGLSCADVTGVSPSSAAAGSQVTVTGLGLEHATVSFGGTAAQVVSAGVTSATVVVPSGSGTVKVSASSVLGAGTQSAGFTYAAPRPPSELPSSARLTAGQSLAQGPFTLIMQGDGNLVLYKTWVYWEVPIWSSGTWGHAGAFAIMQGDGNLVIYAPWVYWEVPIWATGTYGHSGAYAILQGDGNFIVYWPWVYWQIPLWATGT